MKTLNVEAAIAYARSQIFLPDARVAGVLVNADIGPISYGELHGADRPNGQEFVRFETVGSDSRNGYDLVRTIDGVAYVIVTYADHAQQRALTFLKAHIAANVGWYALRQAAWN